MKINDILYTSWGYDQTNIDFYKVTALSPSGKTATIVPIGQKETRDAGFLCEYVVADPENVIGEPLKKKIQKYGEHEYLRMTSYSTATPWDGKEKYQSHYA